MSYTTDRAAVSGPILKAFPAWAEAFEPLIWPCAALQPNPASGGRSWIGGEPSVPAGFAWPRTHASRDPGPAGIDKLIAGLMRRLSGKPTPPPAPPPDPAGFPLAFLLQLDLAEVAPEVRDDLGLPTEGALALFVDVENIGGGSWEAHRDIVQVFHFEGVLKPLAAPADLPAAARFPLTRAELEAGWSLPGYDFTPPPGYKAPDPSRKAWAEEEWEAPFEAWGEPPAVRLGGWPASIQTDVAAETEMAVSFGNQWPMDPAEEKRMIADAARWRLLLEVGSGPSGFSWGNGGKLYVTITREDLAAQRWSRVWLTTQYY